MPTPAHERAGGVSDRRGGSSVARGVGAGAIWALRRPRGRRGPSDLVEIDPFSGRVVGRTVRFRGVGANVDVGQGAVWVTTRVGAGGATAGRASLVRVDPDSHHVAARVPVGPGTRGVAVGEDGVWVTNPDEGTVSRIDPSTHRVVATVSIGNRPALILAGAGAVWVRTELGEVALHRIDPSTNRVTSTVEVALANVGPDAVWVIGPWAPNGALRRLDPTTLRPVGPALGFDILPASVGIAGRMLWVGKYFYYCELHYPIPEGPPIVSFAWFRVDPVTLRALSGPVFVGDYANTPVFGHGAFWVAPGVGGEVIRIDLSSAAQVRPTPTPGLLSPATPAP